VVVVGCDWYLLCMNHREELYLGSLRPGAEKMVRHFLKTNEKIPEWLPDDDKELLRLVKRFKTRHSKCTNLKLAHEYEIDCWDDGLFVPVNWNVPPSKERFVKYAEKHAVPILYGNVIKFVITSDTALEWGAREREIRVKHVYTSPDGSCKIVLGEDGKYYKCYHDGSVAEMKPEEKKKILAQLERIEEIIT